MSSFHVSFFVPSCSNIPDIYVIRKNCLSGDVTDIWVLAHFESKKILKLYQIFMC